MRKVLYLINPVSPSATRLIPVPDPAEQIDVVLLHETKTVELPSGCRSYVLSDNPTKSEMQAPSTIGYADLLRMIFEADTVVAV